VFRVIFILLFVSLQAKTLFIASAGNTAYALPEIKKEFNKIYPNINIKFIIASSGKLTSQIENHAPFDIFLSANMKYPNYLYKKHLAITKPKVYAKGSLVLFSLKKINSLAELKNLKRISIANIKSAPYGKAAFEVLKNSNLYNKVKDKLVYAENINQVVYYVLRGVVEAGFVSKSALFSPKLKKYKNSYIEINKNLYSPIKQGIVIIKDSNEARSFYNFILSKKAKEIFKKYGYQF